MHNRLQSYLLGPVVCILPVIITVAINGCFHPEADDGSSRNEKRGEVRSAMATETESEAVETTTNITCYCAYEHHSGETYILGEGEYSIRELGGNNQGPSNQCYGTVGINDDGTPEVVEGTVGCGPPPSIP